MAVGPGHTTQFYDEVATNKKQRKSTIIAILGSPGKGKTWSGLRLCEIFDKKFDVEKQVVFDREHLLKIIRGEIYVAPGQCVLLDEARMATGARHWFEAIQRSLIDQIAAVRSLGIILIFVILHISMLDKIIRQYVLTYQLHMEKRGVLIEYKVTMPRFESKVYHPRQGKISLCVPGIHGCGSPWCLSCDYLHGKKRKGKTTIRCANMRAVYERRKKLYLSTQSQETLIKVEKQRAKDNPPPTEDMLTMLYENKDLLLYTNRGTIRPSSIQEICEKEGKIIGQSTSTILRDRLQIKYPELVRSKKPSPDT